jgi:hypothetical protein
MEKAMFINPYSQREIDAHPLGRMIPGQQQYMSDEAFAEIHVNASNIRQHVQSEIAVVEEQFAATGDKTLGKRLEQLRENEATLGFIEQGLIEDKGFFQGVFSGINFVDEIVSTKEAWEITEAFRKKQAGEKLTDKDKLALEKLEGEEFQKVATRYAGGYQAGEILGSAALFIAKVTLALKAAGAVGIPVTSAAMVKAFPVVAKSKFLTGAATTIVKSGVVSSTVGAPGIATDYAEYLRGKYEYNWEEAEFDQVIEGDRKSKALIKAVGKDFVNNIIRFGLGPIVTDIQNRAIGAVKQVLTGEAIQMGSNLAPLISESSGAAIYKDGELQNLIVGTGMDSFRNMVREYGGLNGWLGEVVEQLAIKMWTEGVIEEKEFRGISLEQVDDPNVEFNFTPQEIVSIMASMAALQVIAEIPDMLYPPQVEVTKKLPDGSVEKMMISRSDYIKLYEESVRWGEMTGQLEVVRLTEAEARQLESEMAQWQKDIKKGKHKVKGSDGWEANTPPPSEAQKKSLAIIEKAQIASQEDLVRKLKGEVGVEAVTTPDVEIKLEPEVRVGDVAKEVGLEGGVVLYGAKDGKVEQVEKKYSPERTLTEDNQKDILRDLASEGDDIAKELLYGEGDTERDKIDYALADYYIQEIYKDDYDAIIYERSDLADAGQEYHDLKENRFYATNEDLAKIYSNQTRGEKYETEEFKNFVEKVDKYIQQKESGWIPLENAKPLKFEDIDAYYVKTPEGIFEITEATTGLLMASASKLKDAKAEVERRIETHGLNQIKSVIQDNIKETGERPDEGAYKRIRTPQDVTKIEESARKRMDEMKKSDQAAASKRDYDDVMGDLKGFLREKGITISPRDAATIWEARQELDKETSSLLNQMKETTQDKKKQDISDKFDKLSLLNREAQLLEERFPDKFEDTEMDAIKDKMKKGLTPEEAALADKAIEEEVGIIKDDDYIDLEDDDRYMYDMLEETRSMENTPEKAKRIKEAAKEISPKASPDYTYTPEEAAKRGRHIDLISPIDMVTMVEIANDLSDKEIISILPSLRKMGARGVFKGDFLDPQIQIKADIFADPKVAAKVMAHEIGHFVDYLPDRVLKGTFAGKIAAVKSLARNFGEFKDATMRDEVYTLSKDYWRPYDEETAKQSYVDYRKKGEELYADFISMLFVEPSILNKKAPQTLDAFISFLDAKPKVKEKFYEVWDDLTETGIPDLDIRQKKIREMFDTAGSQVWNLAATQQAEKKFEIASITKTLRNEAERLFIDVKQPLIQAERDYMKEMGGKLITDKRPSKDIEALQALPGVEQAYVTTFYEPINKRLAAHGMDFEDLGEWLFLNRIINERGDITPQEAYNSLEGMTLTDLFIGEISRSPDGYLAKKLKNLKEDVLLTQLIEQEIEEEASITEVVASLVDGVIDSIFPEGVPKDENATKFVREFRNKNAARLFSSIFPMKKGIASPLGYTTESAQQQMDFLKEKLGEDNFNLLEEIGQKDFRAGTMAITEMEGAEDYFGENKLNIIRENKDYATFSVNHYLNAHVSPRFREQRGTVKTVMNPAHATAIKNTQMLRAIEYNNARKSAVDFLIEAKLPDAVIEPAPMKYDANVGYAVPDIKRIERMKGKDIMTVMREGKPNYYVMDKKMRDAIYEDIFKIPDEWGLVKTGFKALKWVNQKWFKPVYVGSNLAFNIYNIQKDFSAYWENSAHLNLPEAMISYAKNTKQVWESIMFRRDSEAILELKRNKFLINVNRADIYSAPERGIPLDIFELYETESSFVPLKEMPTETAKDKWEVTKRVFGATERFMNYTEMLPKVSGSITLKEKDIDLTNKEMADMARNYFGSPLFTNKSYLYNITNDIFLFSNATKEGLKRMAQMFAGASPTGSKGAWRKIMRASIGVAITTLLYMLRGQLGPFDDEEFDGIAKFLNKIPTRDLTSFIPLPFGMVGNKAVYFPLGRAEEDQIVNAIVWAMLDLITSENNDEAMESFKDAFRTLGGEVPTVHPLIHVATAIWQTSQGQNPYDSFRGRHVFSPYTFDYLPAGEKWKTMTEYAVDQFGFSIFLRKYDPRTFGEEPIAIEKAHRIPILGNPLYRIARATNFGEVENEWQERAMEDKASRQEKTKTIKMMNADAADLIENNASLGEINELLKVYQEAAVGFPEPKEGYSGDERRKATEVRKMFKKELYRESDVLPSWRILDMHRNDQKANQLLRDKERLTDQEFVNYIRNLRNAEVISDEFVKAFVEKGHISEKAYRDIVSTPRERFHRFY